MRTLFFFSLLPVLLFGIYDRDSAAQVENADVSGEWEITINFIYGVGNHTAVIKQDKDTLSGTYKGEFKEGTLKGVINGDRIDFTGFLKHEASALFFHHTGTVQGNTMEGAVDMGEYWTGTWTARRKQCK